MQKQLEINLDASGWPIVPPPPVDGPEDVNQAQQMIALFIAKHYSKLFFFVYIHVVNVSILGLACRSKTTSIQVPWGALVNDWSPYIAAKYLPAGFQFVRLISNLRKDVVAGLLAHWRELQRVSGPSAAFRFWQVQKSRTNNTLSRATYHLMPPVVPGQAQSAIPQVNKPQPRRKRRAAPEASEATSNNPPAPAEIGADVLAGQPPLAISTPPSPVPPQASVNDIRDAKTSARDDEEPHLPQPPPKRRRLTRRIVDSDAEEVTEGNRADGVPEEGNSLATLTLGAQGLSLVDPRSGYELQHAAAAHQAVTEAPGLQATQPPARSSKACSTRPNYRVLAGLEDVNGDKRRKTTRGKK